MVIRVGKDNSNRNTEENVPVRPKKKKVQSSIRTGESGPMSTIKAQGGLEDPNKVTFGGIESDLYVVEPDDARPRRMDRIEPPEKPEKSRQITTLDYE